MQTQLYRAESPSHGHYAQYNPHAKPGVQLNPAPPPQGHSNYGPPLSPTVSSSAPTPRSYRSRNRHNATNFMVREAVVTGTLTPRGSHSPPAGYTPRGNDHRPVDMNQLAHHVQSHLGTREAGASCPGCKAPLGRHGSQFCPSCGFKLAGAQPKK